MLKFFFIIVSILLITVIFFQVSQDNLGLSGNLFGSSSSAQRRINLFIAIAIFVYFGIAIKFNLSNSNF